MARMTDETPSILGSLMRRKMSRRGFIRVFLSALAVFPFLGGFPRKADAMPSFNGRAGSGARGDYDLVVVKGEDPYRATVKAVEAMGGMGRFVKKGSIVVVKPNIGWDRTPEQAANTNPDVVGALIDLSFLAGAKRVNVFDMPCNEARRCYASSGIERVAREKGANIYFPDEWDMVEAHFGYGTPMEGWPILRDAVECDTFINAPVLKNHGLSRLTIAMKNLMGICGGNRGLIHSDMGRKIVDLATFVRPDLTVVDAYRVLVRNGPTGGSLADVELKKTVFAATDSTLADAYGSTLAGLEASSLDSVREAVRRGFGSADLAAAKVREISV